MFPFFTIGFVNTAKKFPEVLVLWLSQDFLQLELRKLQALKRKILSCFLPTGPKISKKLQLLYVHQMLTYTSSQICQAIVSTFFFLYFFFANNVYEQGNSSILLRCMSNHHHFENNIVARWDPLGRAIYYDSSHMHSFKRYSDVFYPLQG